MSELSIDDVFKGDTATTKLLEELEAMYPSFTPQPSDDDRTIMYRSGQRSVVEYLKAKLSEN